MTTGHDRLLSLLRCPRCRGALRKTGDELSCSEAGCALSARPFPRVGTQPALIDFERSVVVESELVLRSGASMVTRGAQGGVRGALRRIAVPRNRAAEAHARKLADRLSEPGRAAPARLLVVGGATRGNGAEALYEAPGLELIAFDVYASPLTQFLADAHQIPLADASVDAVWIQAVLEHVLEPARVVGEIERVLVPGGLVYAETPFLQHVHEGPWDFTRFTESGHRWLFRAFERLDSGVVAGPATTWVWATEMLVRGLTRSLTFARLVPVALFWVRWLDRWIAPGHASDGASVVYFFGKRSGTAISPSEAVRAYRGAQQPSRDRGTPD